MPFFRETPAYRRKFEEVSNTPIGRLATKTHDLWLSYQKSLGWTPTRQSVAYRFPDVASQLANIGVQLINQAMWIAALTPIDDIKISDIPDEASQTVRQLKSFGQLDQIDGREGPSAFELVERELVLRARTLGVSWRQIGEALNMSGTGIQKRAVEKQWISGDVLS